MSAHRPGPALLALAALAAIQLAAPAAGAQTYPWCAVYGGDMDGTSNCGFSTLEQCRATISGIGGSCEQNLFYVDANRPNRPPRKRVRN
jgi:hypothetical protein